jgi:hypothetical protein
MLIFIPCQVSPDRKSCLVHGGVVRHGMCITGVVLEKVAAERERQFARYGTNEQLEDGTGPDVKWLAVFPGAVPPLTASPATRIERLLRNEYLLHEATADNGLPTWMHLVREEIAEAFQEDDPARLVEELIQVAALCVSWIEKKLA